MSKRLRFFFKYTIILVLSVTIIAVVEILIRPSRPFYEEEKDTLDVLFFGTSVCYCAFDPNIIRDYGISSYNLGRSQQTLSWTYYYIKDALSQQLADTIIIEPFAVSYKAKTSDDISLGTTNANFDKMEFSADALAAAYHNTTLTRMPEFVFPITRWHSDISMLENIGKAEVKDEEKGYVRITQNKLSVNPPTEQELNDTWVRPMDENVELWLDKIGDYAIEKGVRIIVVRSPFPYDAEYTEEMNAIKDWCDRRGITFLDLTHHLEEMGIDCTTDSYDGVHLNESGSEKTSRFLGQWLQSNVY